MTEHKPILIVIAGPNGSGKTTITSKILKHEWLEDATLLFRFANGNLMKKYITEVPQWAVPLLLNS